jgi:Tol biopolymer transport system component
MQRLNGYRMRLMLVGVVAAIVFGGGSAKADFTFGEPTNLRLAGNDPYNHGGAITSDNLEQYFNSTESAWDIYVTTRATPEDNWTEPVRLDAPINTQYTEAIGCISPDGLELYFTSDRPGGSGHEDIWVTRRESMQYSWGAPVNLGSVINSSAHDPCWSISDDGLELYFWSIRSGGGDIYVTSRATKGDPWQGPVKLSAVVNSSSFEGFPLILNGGLMLLFSDAVSLAPRPGGYGGGDIWMTTRATRNDDWNVPVNLGPKINTTAYEGTPKISPDGSTLYFGSTRPGSSGATWGDAYQAPIIPIVDFNGDGIVDASDMCIVVDHWGEDYSLCDIGPMPWGDGVVDVEDLKVLAEHLFEEFPPVELEPAE